MFNRNAFLEKYEINDGHMFWTNLCFERSAFVGKTRGIYEMKNVCSPKYEVCSSTKTVQSGFLCRYAQMSNISVMSNVK